jgi:hypothetical protein
MELRSIQITQPSFKEAAVFAIRIIKEGEWFF